MYAIGGQKVVQMSSKFLALPLPGCYEIRSEVFTDDRGSFRKSFSREAFVRRGLYCDFVESYTTVSRQGVLRGMHFQAPPHDHTKLVTCLTGAVIDVILDLRKASGHYGKYCAVELSEAAGNALYIPSGLAHGFFVPRGTAMMAYWVTSAHSPSHDCGIAYDSFGFFWPCETPTLSHRDRSFGTFADFLTPF